jgi:type I restriction enzyme M protein
MLEKEVAEAKAARDAARRREAQTKLDLFRKEEETRQKIEARALLKERWDYSIFMYEAEKVGITATGEPDQNELFPNPNQPPHIEKTCLEIYQEFKANPQSFFVRETA